MRSPAGVHSFVAELVRYGMDQTLFRLTLMESSCCLKSSASLLGENILLCRELLGGNVVGIANTPPSESLLTFGPKSERGRLRPPEKVEASERPVFCGRITIHQIALFFPPEAPALDGFNRAPRTEACCRPQFGLRTLATGPFPGGVRFWACSSW